MDWFFEFPELGRRDLRDFRKGIDEGFKNFTRTHGEAIEACFSASFSPMPWISRP